MTIAASNVPAANIVPVVTIQVPSSGDNDTNVPSGISVADIDCAQGNKTQARGTDATPIKTRMIMMRFFFNFVSYS